MNGTALTGTADAVNANVFNYNFLMGTSDATITVEMFDKTVKDHAIVFEDNSVAFPIGLPEGANVGDVVSFKCSVLSGNELAKLEVLDDTDTPVQLDGSQFAGYSFEMPDSDVRVVAHTLGGYFKVSVSEDLLFEENEDSKISDVVYGFLDENDKLSDQLSTFIRAGDTIKVVGKHQYAYEGVHYFANGVEMLHDEESDYYTFTSTMPGNNVEIRAVAESRTLSVEIDTNTEAVQAFVYLAKDTEKTPITTAKPGDTVRIEAKVVEGKENDFAIRDINGFFDVYENNRSQKTTQDKIATSAVLWAGSGSYYTFSNVDDNTKEFTIPSSKYYANNKLTLTLGVSDLNKYQNADFLGTWYAQEFFNYKIWDNGHGTFTINGAGLFTGTVLNNISIESGEATDHVFGMADGRTLLLSDDYSFGAIQYDNTSNLTNMKELYVLTKGETAPKYETFTDATNQFFVTRIFVGGECIGAVYADNSIQDAVKFMLVTVELIDGTTSIATDGAKFFVKKDGTIVKSVGVGAEYGEYTDAEGKVLKLDGNGMATLDSQEGTYVVRTDNIEVKIQNVKYVITINQEDMSFVIVSQENVEPSDDPFAGLSFSGQATIYDMWDDSERNSFTVTFTITVVFNDDGTLNFTQQSNKSQVTYANFELTSVAYTYDAEGNFNGTCTMVLENAGSKLKFTSELPNVDDGQNTIISAM